MELVILIFIDVSSLNFTKFIMYLEEYRSEKIVSNKQFNLPVI